MAACEVFPPPSPLACQLIELPEWAVVPAARTYSTSESSVLQLRFFRSIQAERLQRATPRENLIEHGADITIRNNKGQTVVEAAKEKGPLRQEALRKAIEKLKKQ